MMPSNSAMSSAEEVTIVPRRRPSKQLHASSSSCSSSIFKSVELVLDHNVPPSYPPIIHRRRQLVVPIILAIIISMLQMSKLSLRVEANIISRTAVANDNIFMAATQQTYLHPKNIRAHGQRRINAESNEEENNQGPYDERGNIDDGHIMGNNDQDHSQNNDINSPRESNTNNNAQRQLSSSFDNILNERVWN